HHVLGHSSTRTEYRETSRTWCSASMAGRDWGRRAPPRGGDRSHAHRVVSFLHAAGECIPSSVGDSVDELAVAAVGLPVSLQAGPDDVRSGIWAGDRMGPFRSTGRGSTGRRGGWFVGWMGYGSGGRANGVDKTMDRM